ncbi:putative outer membrane starch-binding protein [Dysgonomonas alginatilytica]|uniref:Putative outer membrane starch-binding protein n=1 Tax=Dysgonomonas alginatilytica TaxID=1605892 RepID=A0A2V3PK81_9BACT|nr:RagB/SusD family nutrient uptake outer membrane protein [Dysgonomonas alginatilytica]PXV58926.1 putative outer membrane starch-binding protein [Dysgonomonas alginatilytica]
MKKQNLNNIYIISILLGIINLGCSDIFDKSPLDAVSDGTFWNTESDADLALIGCYDVNEGWGGEDFWVNRGLLFIDLAAGNGSEKENFTSSITDGTLNSSHWAMEAYWKHSYERIATCNNFLDNIGKIQMKDTKKNMMISEIRTIRAYEYFNLGLYFGNVPLVEHVLTIEQANSVFQSTRDVIWAFAEKELKESCEALPPSRPDSEQGRITQAAALAILGRLQMAGKKWSDAAESYKKIIDYNY